VSEGDGEGRGQEGGGGVVVKLVLEGGWKFRGGTEGGV
jgi:hypothetical protein